MYALASHLFDAQRQIVLVVLTIGEVYLVDLRKEHRGRFELVDESEQEDDEYRHRYGFAISLKVFHKMLMNRIICVCRSAFTVARFDPSGKHVFVGTSQGTILVFNTRTKTVRSASSVVSSNCVSLLAFSWSPDTGFPEQALC